MPSHLAATRQEGKRWDTRKEEIETLQERNRKASRSRGACWGTQGLTRLWLQSWSDRDLLLPVADPFAYPFDGEGDGNARYQAGGSGIPAAKATSYPTNWTSGTPFAKMVFK